MRVLITGAAGFVGRHLAALTTTSGDTTIAMGREPIGAPDGQEPWGHYVQADLVDATATRAALRDSRPDAVFHLAASASVASSWRDPAGTLENNLVSTVNLLEAVRKEAPEAVVVAAGSGEVYGAVPEDRLPVSEEQAMRPQNPYAASKAAVDLVGALYEDAHGLAVIRTRSFNHAGPGQSNAYAVSAFAKQIADAEQDGKADLVLETGNLEPRRDFTDVRDVVRAYRLLAERGAPGAYNVCSGVSVPMVDILTRLAALTKVDISQRTDPSKLREHEVMDIRGSHDRLTEATGWNPEIPLDRTLSDTLDWWRAHA